jgi:hypothetical protein
MNRLKSKSFLPLIMSVHLISYVNVSTEVENKLNELIIKLSHQARILQIKVSEMKYG